MIQAPSICSQQLLHEQSWCLPGHYTRGAGYQCLAAATGFCEVALVSKAGKVKVALEKLPLSCSPRPLLPSILRHSFHLYQLHTDFSLSMGFSCLFLFLSSWTLHFSHIYRFLGVAFNVKRLQSMLVHYLNNRYIRSTGKRNICLSTTNLHFGFLFIVDQLSKYCLDKIKLESVHSDRFMGPSWQVPI